MKAVNTKIYTMIFARVYPLYILKAEKKVEQKQRLMNVFFGLPDMIQRVCKKS
jgi:hypothetical protein